MKSKANALYIHIPFCRNICTYCDFKKFIYNQKRIDDYFKSLFLDLQQYSHKKYKSIYIGGGTPSCIDYQNLKSLLEHLKTLLDKNYVEFCIESNVEDINEDFLKILCENKVNRLSIGVQTFNEKFIKFCGRKHTKKQAIENIKLASKYIKNLSIDLIFAFPGQTLKDIQEEIKIVKSLPIKHLSYYSLLIEPNTILYAKKTENVNDIIQEKLYKCVYNNLKKIGFNRYEISNFSRYKKYESYHNKIYWKNKYYDAAGLGASGYFNKTRYVNNSNIIKYINKDFSKDSIIPLTKNDIIFEEIMLSLRLDEGLNIQNFNKKFGINFIERYKNVIDYCKAKKPLILNKTNIKTTLKGSLLLNSILELFLD
jgi:oxygen-independent coproporphyrinogen-3 oxidase